MGKLGTAAAFLVGTAAGVVIGRKVITEENLDKLNTVLDNISDKLSQMANDMEDEDESGCYEPFCAWGTNSNFVSHSSKHRDEPAPTPEKDHIEQEEE